MGKLSIFIVVLFLTGLALLAIDNKEITTIKIPFDEVYEIPKIALILLSSVAGALAMLIVFTIRDTKRFIGNWQHQRKQKKEARVQELYSRALNALLAHAEDEAKEPLEIILQEEPKHLHALLRLGDIACSEDNYQQALIYYNKVFSAYPLNLEVLFALENLMEKTGRWADALNYIEKILDIDADNLAALYKKRAVHEREEKWDELVDVQKTILKHEHAEKDRQREQINLLGYKYEYGRNCLENGELEKARKAFKTIMRLNSSFIPAYLGLAEVKLREGETDEVADYLEKCYEQTSSLIILARFEDLLINLGEPSRLIRLYQNLIAKNPQNIMLRVFLGKLYYRLEMIDDAIRTFDSIDTTGVTMAEIHKIMGDLYLKRGQCDLAAIEYKKAMGIKPAFRLPYWCSVCGYSSKEWVGRCPDCSNWNTFSLNIDDRKI
ncbi:MAG: tetratricopeptide repeat protein [Nitrospiraceae bacterium]|nr:tetratricopeptide repeat protein [Nitrospiraceae bacterium]